MGSVVIWMLVLGFLLICPIESLAQSHTREAIQLKQKAKARMEGQLYSVFRTNDKDWGVPVDEIVQEVTFDDNLYWANHAEVCLKIGGSGWWKGIGIDNHDPTIKGEGRDMPCHWVKTNADGTRSLTLTFWKAKAFGAHTYVGTEYNVEVEKGWKMVLNWKKDSR